MSTAVPTSQRKLKYVASINDEALGEDTDADFEIQYVDISNVDSSGRIGELPTYRFEDAPSRARRRVRDGDVVISTVRTYLQAIAQIQNPPKNMIASTGFAVVRPLPEFHTSYFKYALRELGVLAEIEKRSVGVNYPAINASDLASIPIHVHPLAQQRTIADYLDRETARIDDLVAEKERLLKLLAEKRQVLITRAVTRGLEPNVPLRDSGIPWLGEIPAHWEVTLLRFACCSIETGGTPSIDYLDDTGENSVNWFTPGDFGSNFVLRKSVRRLAQEAVSSGEAKLFPAGSVFAVGIGTLGKVGIIEAPASANQQINAMIPRGNVEPHFLAHVLWMLGDVMAAMANSATLPILNQQRMGEMRVPIPPIFEQRMIASTIASDAKKIESTSVAAKRTISLLKERRSALISAAVTGQIDIGSAL